MHTRSDHDLLVLTTRGDDGAARELWARWGARLIAFAAVKDVGSWLARAVRNEALNHIRASERRRAHTAAVVVAGAPEAGAFEEVRETLAALPEALREIVLLKHVAGLTFDQVALALDDNRSTIASRYAKAVRLMREFAAGPLARPQEVRT